MFSDKVVLVTGGTGSFGRTVVRDLLKDGCGEIRILSRDEEKQDAMRTRIGLSELKFYIGDVRDRASVDGAMRGVDFVFHAAALKQVPSCEFFPIEAVKTNVLGSSNVMDSAIQHKVRSIVCLSTDKAVFPINAMGMTKGLMEKVAHAAARRHGYGETVISCVRYGNVMYSRGSVIPLFIQQIKEGRKITVTEPTMTRFMLPLTEAVGLVKFALQKANQGDIFIRKAAACTIDDLVTALLELFEAENAVETIGMRHGEKLYETLASADEMRRAEDMGDYYRVPMDARELDYAKYFTEGDILEAHTEHYHSHNTSQLNLAEIKELLLALPEIRHELNLAHGTSEVGGVGGV